MAAIKTGFKDAVGKDSVPRKGTGKAAYDVNPLPGAPGRDGGLLEEVTYDRTFTNPPGFTEPGKKGRII